MALGRMVGYIIFHPMRFAKFFKYKMGKNNASIKCFFWNRSFATFQFFSLVDFQYFIYSSFVKG